MPMSIRLVSLVAVLFATRLSASAQLCPGDCDRNLRVSIEELVTGVAIGLGTQSPDRCSAADRNHDRSVDIAELIGAVNGALDGCVLAAACQSFVIAEARETASSVEYLSGPAIGTRRDGGFAIAWTTSLGGLGGPLLDAALHIQSFDSEGLPLSDAVRLPRSELLSTPHIAFGSDSRLFAAWGEIAALDAAGGRHYVRALAAGFDANGVLRDEPNVLRDGLEPGSFAVLGGISDLDADGEGRAAVLFPARFAFEDQPPAALQRLGSRAQPLGTPLPIAVSYNPRMLLRADGTAAVVVTERGPDIGQELRLYMARPGGRVAAPIVIAPFRSDEGGYVEVTDAYDIALAGDRHAIVVWLQDEVRFRPERAYHRVAVYARRVDLVTGLLDEERALPLDSFAWPDGAVRVAATPEGDFAVLLGAALQRFTPRGEPDGGPFPAIEGWESYDDRDHRQRGLGITADGTIVVALSGFRRLYGRRLARADRDLCEAPYAPTPIPSSTLTATPTFTITATRTPTITPSATPTPVFMCGDGLVSEASCELCPADCTPRLCAPSGETVTVTVSVAATTGDPIGQVHLRLAYRTDVLSLPGTGSDVSVRQRVRAAPPIPLAFMVDDLDFAVRVMATRAAGLGDPVATARFDRCVGSPLPGIDDLACHIESCWAASGPPRHCTCTVGFTP